MAATVVLERRATAPTGAAMQARCARVEAFQANAPGAP
jgi:hypothetical protein